MTITAKVIEDSIAPNGKRITTFQLMYPRFIHAEFLTHRMFSRNASSSRAIPVMKMIERALADPAFFVHIGKNQPGMQANEQVDAATAVTFEREWNELAQIVASYVGRWSNEYGIHKQVANRALEPWQHISVIVTTTETDNWRSLRKHPDAQPEIHELAIAWDAAMDASTPVLRKRERMTAAAWHLPYVTAEERLEHADNPTYLAKLSAARCARVSYLTHDGRAPNEAEDLALYERLVGGVPLHASPIEHQAYPLPLASQRSNNFFGWRQNRELVEFDIYHPQPQE